MLFKFGKIQRTVIQSRWQPEAIIYQCLLTASVSCIHSSHLRNRNVGLVHNHQKIIPEEINQGIRCLARLQSRQMAGIIFNSGTETGLFEHLHIKIRPLCNTLRLQQLIILLKPGHPLVQFLLNCGNCPFNLFLRHHIMRSRKNSCKVKLRLNLTGKNIHLHNPVNLVPEKLNPKRILKRRHRNNLQYITPHTEASPLKIHLISYILNINQAAHHLIPVDNHARPERKHHLLIVLFTSDTVNA